MSNQRALITGISGQDGSYLAELLLGKGYQVFGLVRSERSEEGLKSILQEPVNFVRGDLTSRESIHQAIEISQPDELYNLGSQSSVSQSFRRPEYTGDVSGQSTVRVLEAVRHLSPQTKVYQAASSELFGRNSGEILDESAEIYPCSPYAAAKAYAFHMVRNYREAYGLFAVNGIQFNHESPRRGDDFVTRKITKAAASISLGMQETLQLGNMDVHRDWGYAKDYAEAMWLMLQQDEPEDYVIATGESHSVREFCQLAFDRVGLTLSWSGSGLDECGIDSDGHVRVRVNPDYFRPTEVQSVLGDATKARQRLGWKTTMNFDQIVHDMVDHDLERLRKQNPSIQ